jgi:hypothetical protein
MNLPLSKGACWIILLSLVNSLAAGEANDGRFIDHALPDCGIQKEINAAAASSNGVVRLPAGTFALRRGLVLKSGVELVGAGMDKTILTPVRKTIRLDVVGVAEGSATNEHKFVVKELPDSVKAGLGVMLCPVWPPAHIVHTRPGVITAVDPGTKTVTVLSPYGAGKLTSGKGVLLAGVQWVLEKAIQKGDTEIVLKNAADIKPGDELTLGTPPNESLLNHVFVKEVKGNTVVLETPVAVDFALWPPREKFGNDFAAPLVWASFPMIHSAKIKNAAIRELTVKGLDTTEAYPLCCNYTVSGIHLFDSKNVTLERVAVRDWFTDGISIQTGADCRLSHCEATGCRGNGVHIGTGLVNTIVESGTLTRNGQGLYFCWHNQKCIIRDNKITENQGAGIAGLGNPGDVHNLIEKNLVARNGGPGIGINGGMKSGNVIRDNTIEDNSQAKPGTAPGIAVYASTEDALDYTIANNTIRDTQSTPTQYVGIEEKSGAYRDKPTRADENKISGNKFGGHKLADIVVAGSKTVVENDGARQVRASELPEMVKAAK